MYKSATRRAGARNLRIPYAGDRATTPRATPAPRVAPTLSPSDLRLAQLLAQLHHELALGRIDAPAYSPERAFQPDQRLTHWKYGLGAVSSYFEKKIAVVFADGVQRTLAAA